jgi:hypothetical protein
VKRTPPLAIAALVVTLASAARADPPPDQKAAAQTLFDKGRELTLQQNYAEACPKFVESLKLDPGLGTMLWLAECYEKNGQTASAWAEFKEAAGVAAAQKDARETVARRRVTALEQKLSFLAIAIPRGTSTPGIEVRRDGIPVSSAELGLAVPVDPGIHAISATAPGRKQWTANIDVPAGRAEPLVVNVPELEAASETPPPPPTEQPPAPPPESSWSTMKYVGVGVAGVGVVGLVVGSVLGLGAKSALDDSKADGHCLPDNECDATGKSRRADAQHLATGSTIAFIVGTAFVAGGAVLFFTAPVSKKTGLAIAPAVSQREAGVVVGRAF